MRIFKEIKMRWNKLVGNTCNNCRYCQKNILFTDIHRAYCEKHNSNLFNIFREICIDYDDIPVDRSTHIIRWDNEK